MNLHRNSRIQMPLKGPGKVTSEGLRFPIRRAERDLSFERFFLSIDQIVLPHGPILSIDVIPASSVLKDGNPRLAGHRTSWHIFPEHLVSINPTNLFLYYYYSAVCSVLNHSTYWIHRGILQLACFVPSTGPNLRAHLEDIRLAIDRGERCKVSAPFDPGIDEVGFKAWDSVLH